MERLFFVPGRFLVRLGLLAYDFSRRAIMLTLLVTCALASQLPTLKVDTGVATLLGSQSPSIKDYDLFLHRFGHDATVLIVVSAENILSEVNLDRLRELHQEVNSVSPLVARTLSLVNAPFPRRKGDRMVFAGALNPWPETAEQWSDRREAILSYPPYQNVLIDPDQNMTVVVVQLKASIRENGESVPVTTPQYASLMKVLKPLLERHRKEGFAIDVTGEAAADAAIQQAFLKELALFGVGSFLLGALLIWLVFGHWHAVVVPVVVILATVIVCFSIMAAVGVPLQLTASILPPFIVGLGVADSVHLLNAYSRLSGVGGGSRSTFRKALEETALPILMTTLTTAFALFSFMLVEVQALASFGLMAGVSALLAGLFTILVSALVMSGFPRADYSLSGALGRLRPFLDRAASAGVRVSGKYRKTIVIMAVVVTIFSAMELSRLELQHDTLDWVPAEWTEVRGFQRIDEQFGSASAFELVIDSGENRGVLDPDFMAGLRNFVAQVRRADEARIFSAVTSIDSYLQQVSVVMHGRVVDYREHENAGEILWRDARLFQLGMPDEFDAQVSSDYRYARVTLRTTREWSMQYEKPLSIILQAVGETDAFESVSVTGFLPVLRYTLDIIISGAVASFLLSMTTISLLVGIFFKSARIAVASLLPNVAPILVVLAVITLAGRSMDMITIMIGSLVIGVIVDDTIHFLTNFLRARQAGMTAAQASEAALVTSGHAMVITTLVLVCAFATLGLSELKNLGLFASLSCGILLLGLLADFFLMPAIMQWMYADGADQRPSG